MHNIVAYQKLRQRRAHCIVHHRCAKAPAHDKQDRLFIVETQERQAALLVSLIKLRADRRACMHALCTHMRKRILKRYTNLIRELRIDLVCKARRVVRFMRHNGDMLAVCRDHHRHRNKAAL